ncbi:unnamed protein product [Chondrus crispus]|uniref:Uncharacterized protein n=1 Tax=Chondrus crispus TaxID=2769 RepID=R7QSW8_CHOCR|nr:unnamed protein product [Chondrus crispus]CDF41234.1 unnamed protein product [Chondrus crispus]|eukprot:XP_005711528.1 unnamed protein product [Chondrus crispus]
MGSGGRWSVGCMGCGGKEWAETTGWRAYCWACGSWERWCTRIVDSVGFPFLSLVRLKCSRSDGRCPPAS